MTVPTLTRWADIGQVGADICSVGADIGQVGADIGQVGADIGQVGPISAWSVPISARSVPTSARWIVAMFRDVFDRDFRHSATPCGLLPVKMAADQDFLDGLVAVQSRPR